MPHFYFPTHEGEVMTEIKMFPENEISLKTIPHQSSYYSRVQDLTHHATDSILICQYVFSVSETRHWQRSNKVLNSILEAHTRGVDIKILFDRPRHSKPNIKTNIHTFEKLKHAGVDVRCLLLQKTLHIKFMIFDRKIFLAGSHNLTDSSLYSPFELTFEYSDPSIVLSAINYFECLYNGAMSETFESALGDMHHARRKNF